MKRSKPITEDMTFNMENPSNTEGKNYGRHPAKLHYIECGYKRRGFTMISYPLLSGPSLRRWTSTLLRLKSVFIRVKQLTVSCRHPWHPSRCHLFFRPGCLPALLLLPLLLRHLLHSLVFGLPSSVQSSLGSSRSYTSSSTPRLSPSLSSHLHSLRCSVRPSCAPLSQT